jgi:hypothetical protein
MKVERSPKRYPASAFPEITGIRLAPVGATARLLNLSAAGILVECSSRAVPGTAITVHFQGSFVPPTVEGKVVRCEVTGIGRDGALRFHLGLAFNERIHLAVDEDVPVPASHPEPRALPKVASALLASFAASEPAADVVRNRW